jgi:hypothetical protein
MLRLTQNLATIGRGGATIGADDGGSNQSIEKEDSCGDDE